MASGGLPLLEGAFPLAIQVPAYLRLGWTPQNASGWTQTPKQEAEGCRRVELTSMSLCGTLFTTSKLSAWFAYEESLYQFHWNCPVIVFHWLEKLRERERLGGESSDPPAARPILNIEKKQRSSNHLDVLCEGTRFWLFQKNTKTQTTFLFARVLQKTRPFGLRPILGRCDSTTMIVVFSWARCRSQPFACVPGLTGPGQHPNICRKAIAGSTWFHGYRKANINH